ncbi:MAG TPA: hypothetical protein VN950_29625 [Terriglobales bacterium]|nr:hypothetical protein [Terriglobales bacterium]
MTANFSWPGLRSFRGDFGALAAMIQQSWAENPNQSLLYSEAFLRSAFEYPGTSFDLAPTVYGDAGLLGFVAGFPRSVRWDARPARIILNSFLTAATSVKGAGIALPLWADLIERCRTEGYDGTINFCVEGDDMNRIMPRLSRLLKLNTQRIFSVGFLFRLLRPAPPAPPPEVSDPDIDLFMDLASALPSNLPLVRLWTPAEAQWQCRSRAGAITVSSRVGGRRGVLTGYLSQAPSTPPVTVVLLEDLLWGDLEPAECTELLERFLRAAASQGARTASCPMLGYSSLDTLAAARFRPTKRTLHTYLTFWNGLQPQPVPALYIDVF